MCRLQSNSRVQVEVDKLHKMTIPYPRRFPLQVLSTSALVTVVSKQNKMILLLYIKKGKLHRDICILECLLHGTRAKVHNTEFPSWTNLFDDTTVIVHLLYNSMVQIVHQYSTKTKNGSRSNISKQASNHQHKPYSHTKSIKLCRYSQASLVPKLLRLMAKAWNAESGCR